MRLVFMGTPDFAATALRALADRHDILCVYCQPPRPSGRGHRLTPSPAQTCAAALGLPVRHPPSLKSADATAAFAALRADLAVVAAYGLILPKAILDAPRHGCVNIHASLLPRWRGAAPIQRAIEAGDAETGITIMQMDTGLDTGPMLLRRALPIPERATAGLLHDRLADLGAAAILAALDGLAAGTLTPEPQPKDGVTYAHKIDKREAELDFRAAATDLDRKIRAFTPFPGAFFRHGDIPIRVHAAEPVEASGPPGQVLDDCLTVACGTGALRLLRLQRPGRSATDADAFLRGYPLPAGSRLSGD